MGRAALMDARPLALRRPRFDIVDALFSLFLFLSVFHVPLVWFGDESVGLYDFYLLFFTVFLLVTRSAALSTSWREYFVVVFAYFVYLAWHLVYYPTPESILIAMKNGEMFIALFCTAAYLERRPLNRANSTTAFHIVLLLLIAFQLGSRFGLTRLVGIPPGFGIGIWGNRIGLPFMQGTSSNPAGFVLGAFLIVYLDLCARQTPLRRIATVVLVATALLLTVSRTNVIAVLVALFARIFRTVKRKWRAVLIVGLSVGFVALLFNILASVVPEGNKVWNVIRVIRNPQDILLENTFIKRYQYLWPIAFETWSKDAFSVVFGRGLGYMSVVDGTVPRLLVNKGVIGLILFFYIWFIAFFIRFRKNSTLNILLLFALVNAITGETLMISYRAIQVYIPILLIAVYNGKTIPQRTRFGLDTALVHPVPAAYPGSKPVEALRTLSDDVSNVG